MPVKAVQVAQVLHQLDSCFQEITVAFPFCRAMKFLITAYVYMIGKGPSVKFLNFTYGDYMLWLSDSNY